MSMSLPVLEFPDSESFRKSKMADESHCTGSALGFCEQMSQVASTGRVQSQALTRSSSQGGNVYCAQDSHLHHVVDRLVSSIAAPPLRRLDQTGHYLAPARDADRPCQKQVRTGRRKRTPASATHHPVATGKTTRLYQNRSNAPSASGQDGTHLEASAVHCPA